MNKCPEGQICFGRELFVIVCLFIISLIIFGVAKNPLELQIYQPEKFTELKKKSRDSIMNPNQYFYLDNNNQDNTNLNTNNKDNLNYNYNINSRENISYNFENSKNKLDNNHNISIYPNNIYEPEYKPNINNGLNSNINHNCQVPINIPTRGYNTNYKQIGILHSKNKKNGNNHKILPLFGRQKYPGSTKWQYYTNTDGFNTLPIPIIFKGKKCMEEFGCEELSEGDTVRVPAYGQAFRVTLYGNEAPTYIPYIN